MKRYLFVALGMVLTLLAVNPVLSQETPNSASAPTDMVQEISPEVWIQGAEALLIQDVYPWGVNSDVTALNDTGITHDVVNSANLANTALNQYKFVMYASDQPTTYYANIAASIGKIESYVNGGGLLLAHSCDYGWNGGVWSGYKILPGSVAITHAISPSQDVRINDTTHCVVQGLNDSYFQNWNYSTHGYFTNLLQNTKIVLSSYGDPTLPTYIEYSFGSGLVRATMQTAEWGYQRGRSQFLLNELTCAQSWVPPTGGCDLKPVLDALAAVEAKLDALSELPNNIGRLLGAVDALEAKLDATATDLAAAKAERAALETKSDALETKIDTGLAAMQQQVTDLQTKIDLALGKIESKLDAGAVVSQSDLALGSGGVWFPGAKKMPKP